ncbi:hypothetical protein [Absidia glauca]|uniref:Vacuolar protein sorting-associated protein 27 n=1 Tax=Absidia glauca TaxID=4829 RepID=A0A168RYB9_ABSGL|nr:hypothetical protein [Absidia glauca]
MSLWWGTNPLDELIDKATSEFIPAGQENLALFLEISDEIRSKKVNSKDAMRSLKRRLAHKNPNVVLSTLNLTDTCVKNSGEAFVREIASREFMDELVSLLRAPTGCNLDVKSKILSVVQIWGLAAKGKPNLSYVTDTYYLLQAEGYVFPPMTDSIDSIILESSAAPEWTDSDVCERCRTAFTMTNRKHHCRQCGKTFCQQCSSKNMTLPHLAINEEVRVCDGCYIKLKLAKVAKKDAVPSTFGSSAKPIPAFLQQYSDTTEPTTNVSTSHPTSATPSQPAHQATDDGFDDDLKKAIELSLKEEEARKNSYGVGYTPSRQIHEERSPRQEQQPKEPAPEEEDPDLAAAIAASLRDMEISSASNSVSHYKQQSQITTRNRDELSPVEKENIQLFSTLMERVQAASGDISKDLQINKLYTQIGTLQPKLVKNLDETNRKHRIFVDLHEKMNRAVKAYDQLLEQRVSGAHQRSSAYYPPTHAMPSYPPTSTPTAPGSSLYPAVQPSVSQYTTTGYYQQQPQQSYSTPAAPPQQPYQQQSIQSPVGYANHQQMQPSPIQPAQQPTQYQQDVNTTHNHFPPIQQQLLQQQQQQQQQQILQQPPHPQQQQQQQQILQQPPHPQQQQPQQPVYEAPLIDL